LLVACGPLEDWPKVYKAARKGRQFLTVGRDQLIILTPYLAQLIPGPAVAPRELIRHVATGPGISSRPAYCGCPAINPFEGICYSAPSKFC